MPPKESQTQKQKQTVIVNIGDKVVKKKRKRKPRKKAAPRAPPPPPPSPFAPQDFARVIFQPQPPLRPDDNLAVQLNSVTKQLNELQEKQKNRTGNLMAGQRAMERKAEQPMATEEEKPPPPKQRKKKLVIVETLSPPVVETVAPAAEPELRSVSRGRKSRSDKGVPRGQLLRTASQEAIKRGARLATLLPTPTAPEGEELGEQGGSEQGGMVFA